MRDTSHHDALNALKSHPQTVGVAAHRCRSNPQSPRSAAHPRRQSHYPKAMHQTKPSNTAFCPASALPGDSSRTQAPAPTPNGCAPAHTPPHDANHPRGTQPPAGRHSNLAQPMSRQHAAPPCESAPLPSAHARAAPRSHAQPPQIAASNNASPCPEAQKGASRPTPQAPSAPQYAS